jgi:hypothetical protein
VRPFCGRIPIFRRNILPASSGLKCVCSEIGLVIWTNHSWGWRVTEREVIGRNSDRASGKKLARYRTKPIPEPTHFKPEDGGRMCLRKVAVRPCHKPKDHNVCCPNDAEARKACRRGSRAGRLAGLRSISFSLLGIDCSKSCAACLGYRGFSLTLRPCPPPGVVQWACRHHVGATRRGMTRYYHSPATESAECLVERAPVSAGFV